MTPETQKILREPFPAEVVGKLPRVTCVACREATKVARRQTACQQHQVKVCPSCHNRITTGHMHLDYVGHAEVTDRLLRADPEWSWEPLAYDERGLPRLDQHGGLWIRLTVGGTTRIGYGDAEEKQGPDAVKVVIGNAIRLAAMRFGVALDLWGAKFKEASETDQEPAASEKWDDASPAKPPTDLQVKAFDKLAEQIRNAGTAEEVMGIGVHANGLRGKQITQAQFDRLARIAAARQAELEQKGKEAAG